MDTVTIENLYECEVCGYEVDSSYVLCNECDAEWEDTAQEAEGNLYNDDYCVGSESDSDDSYANW